MKSTLPLFLVLLVSGAAHAQSADPETETSRSSQTTSAAATDPSAEVMGAMLVPAALPSGASSIWVSLGAPELAVGYRHGFGVFEFGATAELDYLRLSVAGEVYGRVRAFEERWFTLAPSLGVGMSASTGATYYDADNFAAVSFRVNPGLVAIARLAETFSALVNFEAPMDFALTSDDRRVQVLGGLGGELYVGNDVSLSVLVQGGAEGSTGRGPMRWSPAFQVRFGLGLRLF
jgi:hypothetical protein